MGVRRLDQLWVAEKPSNQHLIERAITALGGQLANSRTRREDGCSIFTWRDESIGVTSVFGHMLEMDPPRAYTEYQKFLEQARDQGRRNFFDFLPFFPDEFQFSAAAERTPDGKVVTRNGVPLESVRLKIVESLIRKADRVVNACDIDREGQLIFDEIVLRRVGADPGNPRFSRMRMTSSEDSDMQRAIQNLEANGAPLWVNLRAAASARQYMDYLLGMNLSMAIQQLLPRGRDGPVLGLGRVKVAVAALVAIRDEAISSFRPYEAFVPVAGLADGTVLRWQRREGWESQPGFNDKGQIVDRALADRIVSQVNRGQLGTVVQASSEIKRDAPPLPYSMGSLMVEAARKTGLDVEQVQRIIQALYERHKLITYVGTDCSYLPEAAHDRAPEILAALQASAVLVPGLASALEQTDAARKSAAFNDEKVDEHFGIIPTGASPGELTPDEAVIYGLVAQRYVAQFMPDYSYTSNVLVVRFGDDLFRALSKTPREMGWRAAADGDRGSAQAETDGSPKKVLSVSDYAVGEQCRPSGAKLDSTKVVPPKPFDQASLAEAMMNAHQYVSDEDFETKGHAEEMREILKETQGIGTARTRADAIKGVLKMGIVVEERVGKRIDLHVSGLGQEILSLLPQALTNIVVTAQWEMVLTLIAKGQVSADEAVAQQRQLIRHAIHHLAGRQEAAMTNRRRA